jgi:hypothetical protein
MTARVMSEQALVPAGHTYQYSLEPLCLYMKNRVLDPCTQKAIHFQYSQILFYLLTQGELKMLQQSLQALP